MGDGCSGALLDGEGIFDVEIGKGLTYSMITLSGETRIEDIIK